MTEETERETSPSLSCTDSSSGFTCEQLQELKKHFETVPNPDKATLEALADTLKLTSWSLGNIVFCLNLSEAMGQSVA